MRTKRRTAPRRTFVAPASNEDSDTVEFTVGTAFEAREAIVDPSVKILQVGRAAGVA